MTIERAAATASDTLDNTSGDQLIQGLTLTPAANDYALQASVQVDTDATAGTERTIFVVYVGGTRVGHTERLYDEDTSIDNTTLTYMLSCVVSPTGSQAVEIRHNASGSGSPLVATNRELNLFPITGTELEVTATGDDTVASATFATLGSMSFTTPASGNRLLLFTTSVEGPSGSETTFRVTVGGSVITHTPRMNFYESSAFDGRWAMAIICEINPNGSQDVEIEFNRSAGSGTITCGARTLTLIPTDAADIFEATGTADDADSTTTDKQIDDMLITDPGDADYMVAFTSTQFWGSITSPAGLATYRIRSGGSTVTDSARGNENENSLDSSDISTRAGGLRVTVASATDDLQVFWEGATTDQRICRERTFVAIREPAVAFAAAVIARLAIRANAEAAKTAAADGQASLATRPANGAAKAAASVGQSSLALRPLGADQKTAAGTGLARLSLRAFLDGVRAFNAVVAARLALRPGAVADKGGAGVAVARLASRASAVAAKTVTQVAAASLALRAFVEGVTVHGFVSAVRLALRPFSAAAKATSSSAADSLALRASAGAAKTAASAVLVSLAQRASSAAAKVAAGISAASLALRGTLETVPAAVVNAVSAVSMALRSSTAAAKTSAGNAAVSIALRAAQAAQKLAGAAISSSLAARITHAAQKTVAATAAASLALRTTLAGVLESVFNAASQVSLAMAHAAAGAKTAAQVAVARVQIKPVSLANKVIDAVAATSLAIRAATALATGFVAVSRVSLALRSTTDAAFAKIGTARTALALRATDATGKVAAGSALARLAIRPENDGEKSVAGIAFNRFALTTATAFTLGPTGTIVRKVPLNGLFDPRVPLAGHVNPVP